MGTKNATEQIFEKNLRKNWPILPRKLYLRYNYHIPSAVFGGLSNIGMSLFGEDKDRYRKMVFT